eukprot:scaffold502891_cov13-Prasinocladus_malaysianus.AAC.1
MPELLSPHGHWEIFKGAELPDLIDDALTAGDLNVTTGEGGGQQFTRHGEQLPLGKTSSICLPDARATKLTLPGMGPLQILACHIM